MSKKPDNKPVNQKYRLLLTEANISLFSLKIAIAGITVIKIPAKSFATSRIGNQVKPFSGFYLNLDYS